MPVNTSKVAGYEGAKPIVKGWYQIEIRDARVVNTKRGDSVVINAVIIGDVSPTGESYKGMEVTDFLNFDVDQIDSRFRNREINKIHALARVAGIDLSEGEFNEQELINLQCDVYLTPSTSQEGLPSGRVANFDELGSQTTESDFE